ncbi:MAG: N-acetyltransferase [Actinophytocola sp.]|uniref:GNAT family N-acetyltransferase n=1 Tax=Actinophytocola sp. TaxID=1872138 RepID=UPI003C7209EB
MSADNGIVAQDVSVRQAVPDDFEALHEVDGRVFGDLGYPYFTLRQLFDGFPECWLVAAGSKGLVGYSLGVPSIDRSYAWLFGLAVDAAHRNRGYGRRLTVATLDMLRAMRVETVRLTTEPENEAAIRLYQAFGFRETGFRKNYLGPGEHRLLMTLRLGGIPTPRPDRGQG